MLNITNKKWISEQLNNKERSKTMKQQTPQHRNQVIKNQIDKYELELSLIKNFDERYVQKMVNKRKEKLQRQIASLRGKIIVVSND